MKKKSQNLLKKIACLLTFGIVLFLSIVLWCAMPKLQVSLTDLDFGLWFYWYGPWFALILECLALECYVQFFVAQETRSTFRKMFYVVFLFQPLLMSFSLPLIAFFWKVDLISTDYLHAIASFNQWWPLLISVAWWFLVLSVRLTQRKREIH